MRRIGWVGVAAGALLVTLALAWLAGPPLIMQYGLWGALASLAIGLLLPAAAQYIHLALELRARPRPQALL